MIFLLDIQFPFFVHLTHSEASSYQNQRFVTTGPTRCYGALETKDPWRARIIAEKGRMFEKKPISRAKLNNDPTILVNLNQFGNRHG